MWFLSRREVASSICFFMQECSGWNPFLQYEQLNFSFPWCPFPLFFLEPEDSSCCWFSNLGLGASNLVFGFFCCFPLPFISLGPETWRAWSREDMMIPIWTSLSCSLVRDLLQLQCFTKFLKILDPPFWFCLVGLLISFDLWEVGWLVDYFFVVSEVRRTNITVAQP